MCMNYNRMPIYTFAIIGGGIAGVSCAEQLAVLNPEESILLVTASPIVKVATNLRKLTKGILEEFDVEERSANYLTQIYPNIKVITATVSGLDAVRHEIYTEDNQTFIYKMLCICSGGKPKVIAENHPYVLGIRDTETVEVLQKKLESARRIVVVGNGGIATEFVYEIKDCQVVWAIKDRSFGATFFDAGAAEFFLPHVDENKDESVASSKPLKRLKYSVEDCSKHGGVTGGSALGPDWSHDLEMKGSSKDSRKMVRIEKTCEVKSLLSCSEVSGKMLSTLTSDEPTDWPVFVELTNGKTYGCDFIVSATGVIPNTEPFQNIPELKVAQDGGITIDDQMKTNLTDVFAAGDVCTTSWEPSKHWFQMRLWTQARQMGAYAAICMNNSLQGEKSIHDFCFEMFTHVTKFFGYKVVLLGLYNGQGLGKNYEILLRLTKGKEYVKTVMQDGRMQGAVLIGETDLEETFENLILDQIDLSRYGADLLNPDVDIEDYFD